MEGIVKKLPRITFHLEQGKTQTLAFEIFKRKDQLILPKNNL